MEAALVQILGDNITGMITIGKFIKDALNKRCTISIKLITLSKV
jgi:hypothetical protein